MHSMQLGFVRHEMKQRIKAGVPEDERVVIYITPDMEQNAEIFTRIHSREFRLRGEMYDVLSTTIKGDTLIYTCIHDVKESGLFKNLDAMVHLQMNDNPVEKNKHDRTMVFFNLDYTSPNFNYALFNPAASKSSTFYKRLYSYSLAFDLLRPPIS